MRWFAQIRFLLKSLVGRRKLDEQLSEEVRTHVEMATEANLAKGMSADEARYAALREFGNVAGVQERARDERGWVWLEQAGQDMKFACRGLRQNPGFTFTVVAILALGIGAVTAVFSVVNELILRPLPVREPDRLVRLVATGPNDGKQEFPYPLFAKEGGDNGPFPYPFAEHFRQQARTLSDIVVVSGWMILRPLVLDEGTALPESVCVEEVSGNYFTALGVRMALGRAFTADEDQPGRAAPVAVISHGYWRERFASDPAVIGRTVSLGNFPLTIVGVAAEGFNGAQVGALVKLWVPIQLSPQIDSNVPWGTGGLQSPWMPWVHLFGRLADGVTSEQASAELDLAYQNKLAELDPRRKQVAGQNPSKLLGQHIELRPMGKGYDGLRPKYGKPAGVLMAMVGLLLVAACLNVTGLLLARGLARQRELAVRAALGASRSRLMRQMLTECLLLAVISGVGGLLLAQAAAGVLGKMIRGLELNVDANVLIFAVLVTGATGLIIGLIPSLRLSHREITGALKAQGGRSQHRMNAVLIVTQFAFALVLLVAAWLFGRTLRNLDQADLGFQRSDRLLFDLNVPSAYEGDRRFGLFQRILERTAVQPGAKRVSLYQGIGLLGDTAYATDFSVEGHAPPDGKPAEADLTLVGAGFFETMGIGLRRGRPIEARDETPEREGPAAMVISEWSARQLFGDADPIGRRIKLDVAYEVVGVAANTGLGGRNHFLYVPMQRRPNSNRVTFAIQTDGLQPALARELASTIRQIEPLAQISNVRTIKERMEQVHNRERLMARLAGFFGGFALLLSALGIFGLVSYSVGCRTREFGIRMALGATAESIVAAVVRQGISLALLGTALGGAASFALARTVEGLLYGVSATDPLSLAAASLLMMAVALLACVLPARRAGKVNPVIALKAE